MSIGKTVTREPQPQDQCGLGKPPKRGWITESRMQVTDPIPSAAASGHTPALGNARREKGERSRSARRIRSECRQPPGSGRRGKEHEGRPETYMLPKIPHCTNGPFPHMRSDRRGEGRGNGRGPYAAILLRAF